MNGRLAPIVLFTYNRPVHTAKAIKALAANHLAQKSDLYIFSDGPKNNRDLVEVQKVRNHLGSIKGFSQTILTTRDDNLGLANSIKNGVTEILSISDRVIVIEDDLFTFPAYLNYMNSMLQTFQGEDKIFSVAGFNYPDHVLNIYPGYQFDIFFSPRPSSWGWGTWKDRWDKADWNRDDYVNLYKDKDMIRRFNQGGDDLFRWLKYNYEGIVDSWAILWSYTLFMHRGLCVYPVNSYVQNLGFDDSATHTTGKDKFHHDSLNQKIENYILPENCEIDPEIMIAFKKVFQKKFIYKVYEWIKKYIP